MCGFCNYREGGERHVPNFFHPALKNKKLELGPLKVGSMLENNAPQHDTARNIIKL